MLSGLGQKLPRFAAKRGVADDGLLEKARDASFILLGLTAAIGLGLVAFIAHLGWPNALDSPIPGLFTGHVATRGPAIAAAPSPGKSAGSGAQTPLGAAPVLRGTGGTLATGPLRRGSAHSRLAGSKAVPVPAPPRGKGGSLPGGKGTAPAPFSPPTTSPAPPTHPSPPPAASTPPADVTAAPPHSAGDHGGGRSGSGGEFGTSRGSEDGQEHHAPFFADRPSRQGHGAPDADVSGTPHGDAGPSYGNSHGYTQGPTAQHGAGGPGCGHGHGYTQGPATQHGQAGPGSSDGRGYGHFGR